MAHGGNVAVGADRALASVDPEDTVILPRHKRSAGGNIVLNS